MSVRGDRSVLAVVLAAVPALVIMAGCSNSVEPSPSPTSSSTASASPPATLSPSGAATPTPSASATPSPAPSAPPPAEIVYKHPGRVPGRAAYIPEQDGPFTVGDAAGSGCSPTSTTSLPDGIWRGIVMSRTASTVEFDLVCSYKFDTQAYAEANSANWEEYFAKYPDLNGERPVGGDPVPYGIVNDSSRLRTLTVSGDALGWAVASDPGPWTSALSGDPEGSEVWVFVNGGVVTEVSEVYYS